MQHDNPTPDPKDSPVFYSGIKEICNNLTSAQIHDEEAQPSSTDAGRLAADLAAKTGVPLPEVWKEVFEISGDVAEENAADQDLAIDGLGPNPEELP
ncbi:MULTISPECIES: hypothetical protein [unclassified Variovorax]|uniref:hypothetical protein n=1 Tax=unclassified Variovorax TaxID=663243 RepID=UPI001315FFFF|nr:MULTISPECIES: hypothetical protein [unclassified Variovorax]VTU42481.1 hypothetical protein H6P1_00202 [Variovorax sp. PBL-H6]VTU43901.1 hypothetical protein SRS16P1_00700 [Variovorax sp. SRS16]VTU43978.1 hypothetical protein E5P1_00693 [Variovorax sp. PBL-E5]